MSRTVAGCAPRSFVIVGVVVKLCMCESESERDCEHDDAEHDYVEHRVL